MKQPYRTKITETGSVEIPSEYRKLLGLCPGDTVLVMIEDGELHIFTPRRGIERAQEIFRQYVPEGMALADELVAERHAEAERE